MPLSITPYLNGIVEPDQRHHRARSNRDPEVVRGERESVTILKTDFTKLSLSLTVDSNGLDADDLATADERVELCAFLQLTGRS